MSLEKKTTSVETCLPFRQQSMMQWKKPMWCNPPFRIWRRLMKNWEVSVIGCCMSEKLQSDVSVSLNKRLGKQVLKHVLPFCLQNMMLWKKSMWCNSPFRICRRYGELVSCCQWLLQVCRNCLVMPVTEAIKPAMLWTVRSWSHDFHENHTKNRDPTTLP